MKFVIRFYKKERNASNSGKLETRTIFSSSTKQKLVRLRKILFWMEKGFDTDESFIESQVATFQQQIL